MSVRRSVLLAIVCLFAGCGGSSTTSSGLQQLQAATSTLRRAGNLSRAVAKDTTSVNEGMAKDRVYTVRRRANRLLDDAERLKRVDGEALQALVHLPTQLTGPARRYAETILTSLRVQRREAQALILVGRGIRSDPLLERSGSVKVLATELRARRGAARVAAELQQAAHIRRAHPKAFTYVPQSTG